MHSVKMALIILFFIAVIVPFYFFGGLAKWVQAPIVYTFILHDFGLLVKTGFIVLLNWLTFFFCFCAMCQDASLSPPPKKKKKEQKQKRLLCFCSLLCPP
jgi:hypothetical protein